MINPIYSLRVSIARLYVHPRRVSPWHAARAATKGTVKLNKKKGTNESRKKLWFFERWGE